TQSSRQPGARTPGAQVYPPRRKATGAAEILAGTAGPGGRRGPPPHAAAYRGGKGQDTRGLCRLRPGALRRKHRMNLHPRFKPFDFQAWIERHRHLLKPPVGNKLVFEEAGMVVMVVGGPNQRVDFHDDPVEEFFYQLEGDMLLKVAEGGRIYDVPI